MKRRGVKAAYVGAAVTALLLASGGYLLRGRILEAWWISRLDSESVAAVEAAASNLVEARSWRAIPEMVEQLERLHEAAGGVSQGSAADLKSRALSSALVRLGPEAAAAWLRSGAPHPSPRQWKDVERERDQLLESLLTCTRHADALVRSRALDWLEGGILHSELLMGSKLSNQDLAGINEQSLRVGLDESALDKLARAAGSLELFERLRQDPDAGVQDVAFEGLDQILERGETAQVAATTWVNALLERVEKRGEWFERHLRLLGHLGRRDARVLPVLLALLSDPSNDVRAAAALGAGALGAAGKPAIPMILDLLAARPGDAAVYIAAAQALGTMGPAAVEAVPILLKLAVDKSLKEEEGHRYFILFALPWMARGSPEAEGALVRLLIEHLGDAEESKALSQGIHRALRALGHRAKAAADLLWRRFEDARADERWPIIYTLLAVEPDADRPLRELLSLATTELSLKGLKAIWARHGAPRALRELGPIALQGLPFLEGMMGGSLATWDGFHTVAKLQPAISVLPRALRRLAVEGNFTEIPDREAWRELGPAVVPCLVEVLDDPDARVRLRSLQILRGMGEKAVSAIPDLERCLSDSLDLVRRQAAATIEEIRSSR